MAVAGSPQGETSLFSLPYYIVCSINNVSPDPTRSNTKFISIYIFPSHRTKMYFPDPTGSAIVYCLITQDQTICRNTMFSSFYFNKTIFVAITRSLSDNLYLRCDIFRSNRTKIYISGTVPFQFDSWDLQSLSPQNLSPFFNFRGRPKT